ncbi:MAG TPA: hypothetical protein VNZ26_15220 [Vicinamibacterales bacterium]|nr:hypothetical protein [Vicinamibacterales bacterium]
MLRSLRWLTLAAMPIFVAIMSSGPRAQGNPEPLGYKFNSGQSVQPIFEGWGYNPDGSVSMYFGYINRNYVETLAIPVGPENKIEPGEADRGQPTIFGTRIHRMAFNVGVPKDWGKKELVWTVTSHGETSKAVGWLQPEWQIDPVYFGKERNAESLKNKPPTLALESQASVTLPNTLTLTATVTDDGLPTPRKGPRRAAVGQETPPTLKPDPNQPEIVLNVPEVSRGRGRGADPGLVVNWTVWRGPANVVFDAPQTQVKNGKATVTATFTQPGTYLLRGSANDGELHVEKDVTVSVKGSPQP